MDAFEVSVSGVIAGFGQRLEASLHQRADAAAQDGLFAEEVGLGLGAERGLQSARSRAADAQRISQRDVQRVAGGVLFDRYEHGYALARLIFAADGVAGSLRGDHDDVDVLGRLDAAEVDIEAVGKRECLAFREVRFDALLIELRLLFIVDEDHDEVGILGCVCRGHDGNALRFRLCPALAAFVEAYDDLDAGFHQVERVRVTLRTVTDDRNCLILELVQIAVLLIENSLHVYSPCYKRTMYMTNK